MRHKSLVVQCCWLLSLGSLNLAVGLVAVGAPPEPAPITLPLLAPRVQLEFDSLYNQTYEAYCAGDFAKERDLRLKWKADSENVSGPEHWRVIEQKRRIASIERILSLPPVARQRILNARTKILKAFDVHLAGEPDSLIRECEEALAQIVAELGQDDSHYVDALRALGKAYSSGGRAHQAIAIKQQVVIRERAVFGDSSYPTALALVECCEDYLKLNRPQDAVNAATEAMKGFEYWQGREEQSYAYAEWLLAKAYNQLGQHEKAAPLARSALVSAYQDRLTAPHAVLSAMLEYARASAGQGQTRQAQAAYDYCLDFWLLNRTAIANAQPDLHPKNWVEEHVACLEKNGKPYSDDVQYVRTCVETSIRPLTRKSDQAAQEIAAIEARLASLFLAGDIQQERDCYDQFLKTLDLLYPGQPHEGRAPAQWAIGTAVKWLQLDEQGTALLKKTRADYLKANKLAAAAGKTDEAIAMYMSTAKLIENAIGRDNDNYSIVMINVAHANSKMRRHREAAAIFQDLITHTEAKIGSENPSMVSLHTYLARELLAQSQVEEAEAHLQRALAMVWKVHPEMDIRHGRALMFWAMNKLQKGEYQQARDAAKHGIAVMISIDAPDPAITASCYQLIFHSYSREKRYSDAIRSYERMIHYLESLPTPPQFKLSPSVLLEYANAWRSLGHEETAAAILAEAGHGSAAK